jgi:hypothetical protein
MTQHEFMNRLRSLYNIDAHQLPDLEEADWSAFARDPARYFIRCSDTTAADIWREVEKRQKP